MAIQEIFSVPIYKIKLDLNVKELSGVAIMTDTDNSKLKAIAYYQNIYFSSK